MKELIRVRVQYDSRQQCCKTHERALPYLHLICVTCFTFKNITSYSQNVFMFRIKPKTNITSLHRINRFVLIVEKRVYCAVRTKLLNRLITLTEFGLESLQYIIKCLVKLEVLRVTANMII